MKIAGAAAELQIVEERSAITFRSMPQRRWVDLGAPLIILVGVLAGGHWVYYVLGAGIIAWWFFRWLRETADELWITDTLLVSSKSGSMRWSEISGLEFGHGGEDDPPGLYARRPWNKVCLLPNISEEQAGQVIDNICSRFQNLPLAGEVEGWSLFGKRGELLSLGLSKPRE